ncbi:MAG TPA: hypothetical protein PKA63_11240 [Oligoflexia bacterium]|nr:hypothetical protein [Oligoflexia bacterium]HMP49232.1 hypothetical protein [Oligoflexia bacterium]
MKVSTNNPQTSSHKGSHNKPIFVPLSQGALSLSSRINSNSTIPTASCCGPVKSPSGDAMTSAEQMINSIFRDALTEALAKATSVLEELKNGTLQVHITPNTPDGGVGRLGDMVRLSNGVSTPALNGEFRTLSSGVLGNSTGSAIHNGVASTSNSQSNKPVAGHSSGGQAVSSSRNGFLWKPVSENNGRLVVLLPANLTGKVRSAAIYSSLPPSPENLIEDGKFSGDHQNGGRSHFRFSKPGGSYPNGSYVVAQLKDGSYTSFQIGNSSSRNS